MDTEAGAVFGAALGDVRGDALGPDLVVDQCEELGDVVSVAAGQFDGEWDARAFGDDVVFRAGPGTVEWARAGFGPPFMARRCEPSSAGRCWVRRK
jgi:hypothetical protein